MNEEIKGQLALDLGSAAYPVPDRRRRVLVEPNTDKEQVFFVGRGDTLIVRDDDHRIVVLVEPE